MTAVSMGCQLVRAESDQLGADVGQERGGSPGMQGHLELFAQLRVQVGVARSEQPGDGRGVTGGGNRKQLGRPVQSAQSQGLAEGELIRTAAQGYFETASTAAPCPRRGLRSRRTTR